MSSTQADRMLVSGMGGLQIGNNNTGKGAGKRYRSRSKGAMANGVHSQGGVIGIAEPQRKNPTRLAKHTEKGKLGVVALGQRYVGKLEHNTQDKKKQVQ